MENKEIPFESGESNSEVVRVGNTVRRSLTRNSPFVHKIMKELTRQGYTLSPVLQGIDEKGREIISYIDGTQMNRSVVTINTFNEAMSALRRFHDILSKYEFCGNEETIIHTDFAPWNLIVKGDKLIGVIDFDDALPGKRLSDVTYACWNFLDIGEEGGKYTEEEILKYLPVLISSYGDIDTKDFVDTLIAEQKRILKGRELRVLEDITAKEKVERENICKSIREQIKWVEERREKIEKVLD
ncbi:aminoglycoside phosphotransferase family protein [Candidatus Dojkabacteria bacterium]|nr:aminoglycoside phosphotransferase family protein [Candidatus Dojkabacteria bacterium]